MTTSTTASTEHTSERRIEPAVQHFVAIFTGVVGADTETPEAASPLARGAGAPR
ncbi:MAG TPA: hypothetical protein VHS57_04780 [Acidimicrobiales bacterium]|nr:hypothetical protein [Acidimicrobiales bacterium]